MRSTCLFCDIAAGRADAQRVHEDAAVAAFLDIRPVFFGHLLLVPKAHVATLAELPPAGLAPFFAAVQLLARAVPSAMRAEGAFIAINDRVSQSVPHLHCHIVPRRRGDGLKGFFWPRQKYATIQHAEETAVAIRQSIAALGMADDRDP